MMDDRFEAWKAARRAPRVPDGFAASVMRGLPRREPGAMPSARPALPIRVALCSLAAIVLLLRFGHVLAVFVSL